MKQSNFQVSSGRIVVSDPCYDLETINYGNGAIVEVPNGSYIAGVEYESGRVANLTVMLEGVGSEEVSWNLSEQSIGVDSGQAGVFDFDSYRNDSLISGTEKRYSSTVICSEEPFYSLCCDRTLSDVQWGYVPAGVVSSCGRGDGNYRLFLLKLRGSNEIVGISISFITEDNDEEYDDYDDYDAYDREHADDDY